MAQALVSCGPSLLADSCFLPGLCHSHGTTCPGDSKRNVDNFASIHYGLLQYDIGGRYDAYGASGVVQAFNKLKNPSRKVVHAEGYKPGSPYPFSVYNDLTTNAAIEFAGRHGMRANFSYADGHVENRSRASFPPVGGYAWAKKWCPGWQACGKRWAK